MQANVFPAADLTMPAAELFGLQGLEQIGYKPNVEQTEQVKFGIKFLYSILPAAFHLIAVLIFQKFPITQEVHAEIRAQLEARRAAEDEEETA